MSSIRHVEQCISRQLAHKNLNAFVTAPVASNIRAAAQLADTKPDGPIAGRLISLKDNITTVNEPTTCSSMALHNYTSPILSTASALLQHAGAIVAGKTNMDEFGMGSHSQSSHSGPVVSRLNKAGAQSALSAGGSSGGSAVAVATGQCWAALGTDTGGSVRLPAAWTGTVGLKPTYGRISRWGVVDYANSLDTVGVLSRDVATARKVYRVLNKNDPKDPTSLNDATRQRLRSLTQTSSPKALCIGIPIEYNTAALTSPVRQAWIRTLNALRSQGHTLRPVSLPSTPLALSAYYILAPAEASSNLARYDGVEYGARSPGPDSTSSPDPAEDSVLYARTRGAAFGPEVRRRILLGTYTLSSGAFDNYFLQAQRVRRLVQREFDGVFRLRNALVEGGTADGSGAHDGARTGEVDVLLAPTASSLPPTLDEVAAQSAVERYLGDLLTVPASLAGLPVVSVPVPLEGEYADDQVGSVGMQVIGQVGDDEGVLRAGEIVEGLFK